MEIAKWHKQNINELELQDFLTLNKGVIFTAFGNHTPFCEKNKRTSILRVTFHTSTLNKQTGRQVCNKARPSILKSEHLNHLATEAVTRYSKPPV